MEPGSETSSTITKLRDRKVVQWTLAYLAGAWALLQIVDVFSDRFDWPSVIFRALTAFLGVGLFAVLIIAWYHGEQGRQSTTGPELLMLAAVLFVAGIAATVIGPDPKALPPRPAIKVQSPARYRNSPGYDALTRGKVALASENNVDTDRAIGLLEQAIAADPNLAPAYAALARAYRTKAFYFADDSTRRRLNEEAAVMVTKALA
ncbi:MAG TPA: hypothetical protein VM100_05860, partial [Longimicrobiales bacterium]|nr:hypothetical protein [Longimicrobiales bacterium]